MTITALQRSLTIATLDLVVRRNMLLRDNHNRSLKLKRILTLSFALLSAPALCGQMFEWRDPATGRLQLGDIPPAGIQYWREGEKRPEQIAEEQRQEAAKAAKAKRIADEKAAKESEQKRLAAKREAEATRRPPTPLEKGACLGYLKTRYSAAN